METVVCSGMTHPSYRTERFHKTRTEIHRTCGMSKCDVNANIILFMFLCLQFPQTLEHAYKTKTSQNYTGSPF